MGNCGVGFAPVAPDRHEWLIGLMEGVEDIPGAALSEGITWGWETFPEYLDVLAHAARTSSTSARRCPTAPCGPTSWASGAPATSRPPPRTSRRWAASSPRASPPARSASRPRARSPTGRSTASRCPARSPPRTSCSASARGHGRRRVRARAGRHARRGPGRTRSKEVEWMRRLAAETGRPVTFVCTQNNNDPTAWRELLELLGADAGRSSPGPWPNRVGPARVLDPPPLHVHAGVAVLRPGRPSVARAGRPPASRGSVARSPGRRHAAGVRAPERPRVHGARAPLRARRSAGLRARRRSHRGRASPPPAGRTSPRPCSTCSSSDDGRALLNSPILNYSDGSPRGGAGDAAAPDAPPSGSATAEPTSTRPAMPRRRPSSCPTGLAIGPPDGCRSSWPCTS